MKILLPAALAAALAGTALAEPTREVASSAVEREALALTVYNDDLALVRERRLVNLPAGLSRLSLREVSAQIRPETSLLRAVTGGPVTLLEQNFDFDLLTPQSLLDQHVGREVTVLRPGPDGGEERRERATVLSTQNGTVLRFADRIETGVPGRLAFDSVPAHLREQPTLSVLLEAAGGRQSLELSYLSGGLSWKADYVAQLALDGKTMDLSGWVTLSNRSGTAYDNASLQLVAGTLNRAPAPVLLKPQALAAPMLRAEPREETLLDYHLYRFERPTSIADHQTKQLALLTAHAIAVRRDYLLASADCCYRERQDPVGQRLKPAVYVEFENRGGQLGQPLPAGVIRVYSRDSRGAAQFVGEDRIGHSAKNETIRLKLGEAFDLGAERRQTSWRKLGDTSAESAYRVELRNARDEPVTVRVQEAFAGDWELLQQSHPGSKESARVMSWSIPVPAGGSAVLDYTVRVRW